MKLALHRSISFWAGILVMGFMAWAWWDSLWNESTFLSPPLCCGQRYGGCFVEMAPSFGVSPSGRVYVGRRSVVVYQQRNWLEQHVPSSLIPGHGASGSGLSRIWTGTTAGRLQILPPPTFIRGRGQPFSALEFQYLDEVPKMTHIERTRFTMTQRGVSDWYLFVPHWLILALLASLWTGLLVWRARRRRRAAASLA